MELAPVDSSMIYAVGYDAATSTLDVVFHNTGVYRYSGVPKALYEGLLAAESKGSYMQSHIIDFYPYTRPTTRRRT